MRKSSLLLFIIAVLFAVGPNIWAESGPLILPFPTGPTIKLISPSSASAGTKVTISGTGFATGPQSTTNSISTAAGNTINFSGSNTFSISGVSSIDGSTLTFIVPAVPTACTNSYPIPSCNGLSPGSYTITVSSSGVTSNGVKFTITNVSTPSLGTFYFSQNSFTFTYNQGGTLPQTQSLTFTNTSKVSITYTLGVPNQPAWLNSGYATGQLTSGPGTATGLGALADPTGLNPGTYTTNIIITGNFLGSPLLVPVTLIVNSKTTPSIKVISPNGSEVLTQGQNNTISWSGGKGTDVQIGLVDTRFSTNGTILGWIVPTPTAPANGSIIWDGKQVYDLSGTTQWPVKSLSLGPYKIITVSSDSSGNHCTTIGCNYDVSDDYFAISGSAQPALAISISASTPVSNPNLPIVSGTANVPLASVDVAANNIDDIKITEVDPLIRTNGIGGNINSGLTNFKLYDGTTLLNSGSVYSYTGDGQILQFKNLNLVINKNTSHTLTIKADAPAGGSAEFVEVSNFGGTFMAAYPVNLTSMNVIEGDGHFYWGNKIYFAGSSSSFPIVSISSATPISSAHVAGQQGMKFTTFNIVSLKNVGINKLTIEGILNTEKGTSPSNALKNIQVCSDVAGGKECYWSTAQLIPDSTNPTLASAQLTMAGGVIVPAGNPNGITFSIYADTSNSVSGGFSMGVTSVGFSNQDSSGAYTIPGTESVNIIGNAQTIITGSIINISPLSLPTTVLSNGSNTILKFVASTANGTGQISGMRFSMATGVDLTQNPNENVCNDIRNFMLFEDGIDISSLGTWVSSDKGCLAPIVTFNNPRYISTSGHTYEIKVTVGNALVIKYISTTLPGNGTPGGIILPTGSNDSVNFTTFTQTINNGTFSSTPANVNAANNTITIYARGTPGNGQYPRMELRMGATVLDSWIVTGNFAGYTFTTSKPITDNLRVYFTNDYFKNGEDRNLYVDSIFVNNTVYHSTDPSTYVKGAYVSGSGCSAGFRQTQELDCNNAFFEYPVVHSVSNFSLGDVGRLLFSNLFGWPN